MNRSGRSFTSRFKHSLIGIGLLALFGFSYSSLAGMTWSARAIDPSLVGAIKSDNKLLDQTLFGDQPEVFTQNLKKEGGVDLSDKQTREELTAWAAKGKVEVGDTEVDLDKAWHGIHYLLTGSVESNGTRIQSDHGWRGYRT